MTLLILCNIKHITMIFILILSWWSEIYSNLLFYIHIIFIRYYAKYIVLFHICKITLLRTVTEYRLWNYFVYYFCQGLVWRPECLAFWVCFHLYIETRYIHINHFDKWWRNKVIEDSWTNLLSKCSNIESISDYIRLVVLLSEWKNGVALGLSCISLVLKTTYAL